MPCKTSHNIIDAKEKRLVRLSLSAKSASYSVVFFSYNKSANNTFSNDLSAKQIGPRFPYLHQCL
jgi:hypothetical protein